MDRIKTSNQYSNYYITFDDPEEWADFDLSPKDGEEVNKDAETPEEEEDEEEKDQYAHLKKPEVSDPNWCSHEFVDNGFRRAYCVKCHCVGELQPSGEFRRIRD